MSEEKDNRLWELVAEEIHHELSSEEVTELKILLGEGENARKLEKAKKLARMFSELEPLTHVSQTKSWEGINKNLKKRKVQLILAVCRYAAIVIFALLAGFLIRPTGKQVVSEMKATEVYVPLGQMSQVSLPDGTEVWLNSGTTLSYFNSFGQNSREVNLSGEAYFKVVPGMVPFRVKLKNSEVEVIGTSFNILSFDNENFSEVTLVEGSVRIKSPEGAEVVKLNPGEQLILSGDLKNNVLKNVETQFYVSWTDGKIVFEEERLADITERLERWYNVEIKLTDESIGNYRFSGTILKNKPFDQIIKAFTLLLPVHIEYTHKLDKKDTIIISKK